MSSLTRPRYSQIYDTDYKQSVRLATTGDVGNLFTTGSATNSVDGVTVVANDRILVKDQTNKRQNGIYVVVTVGTGSNGTWQRSKDADASDKVTSGMTITVSEGVTNINRTFKLATPDPIVLNTTELDFNNPFLAVSGGANTTVQFNDGLFTNGSTAFTFNKATNVVTMTGNVSSGNLSATYLTGTLLTASQPNITTLGNITNLGVAGNLAVYSTVDSTSPLTGAVIISGGLAVQKSIHVDADTDIGGNLILTRPNTKILADFHNATVSQRVAFQSNTNNQNTSIGAMPSGTNSQSDFTAYNSATVDNASYAQLSVSSSLVTLDANKTGSGTYLPLIVKTTDSERVRVDINGNVLIGTANATAYSNVTIAHTTTSTSSTTGALVVSGGAGVVGNLRVGGTVNVISGNLGVGASPGVRTLYVVSPTDKLTIGTFAGASYGVRLGTIEGSGAVIEGVDTTGVSSYQPLFVGGSQVSITTSNTERVNVAASGNVVITNATQSTSTTTGALVVGGGVGIQGNLNVSSNIVSGNLSTTNVTGTLLTAAQPNITSVGTLTNLATTGVLSTSNITTSTSTTTGALQVGGGAGIAGNVVMSGILTAGAATGVNLADFSDTVAFFSTTANSFSQLSTQNLSAGTGASTDIAAYANNGNATVGWIDMGITSNNYINQNGIYGITGKNDGYIFVAGTPSGGGNLVLATGDTGLHNDIVIATGGFDSIHEQARFIDGVGLKLVQGTASTNTSTGALIVSGGVGVQGNLNVGGNINLTGNLNLTGNAISFATNNLTITDSIVNLAEGNSADLVDIGLVAHFVNPAFQHTGFVRDASDGTWKLFANVVPSPTTTVDFTDATYSNLRLGNLTVSGGVSSVGTGTGALTVTGGVGVSGNINAGNVIATNLTGTVLTASQTNITAVGNLSSLSVAGTSTVYGNLTLAGTTQRIFGDFSNATFASRLAFQDATTNNSTFFTILPNGTSQFSSFQTYNNSNPTNASYGLLGFVVNTEVTLASSVRGSGTFLPITFRTRDSERVRIDTNGNVLIGTANVLSYSNLTVAYTTTSTSTSTGAVVVAGGAGIAGNLNAGGTTHTLSGCVSIGTTTIRAQAHIFGAGQETANLTDAGTRGGMLRLSDNNSNAGSGGVILFANSQGDNANSVGFAAIKGLLFDGSNNTAGSIAFSTRNSSAATSLTERLRIDTAGNVLVFVTTQSTSTATGALTVAGGVGIASNLNVGGNLTVSSNLNVTSGNVTARIVNRVSTTTSTASITPDVNSFDMYTVTAQAVDLTINAPTGFIPDGTKLMFRIRDNGTARNITFTGSWLTPIGVIIPTATTANKTVYLGAIYNAGTSAWDCIALSTQA